jgi:hypothetical protein
VLCAVVCRPLVVHWCGCSYHCMICQAVDAGGEGCATDQTCRCERSCRGPQARCPCLLQPISSVVQKRL